MCGLCYVLAIKNAWSQQTCFERYEDNGPAEKQKNQYCGLQLQLQFLTRSEILSDAYTRFETRDLQ